MKVCKTPGCTNLTKTAYCKACHARVRYCDISGCGNELRATNRSGFCYDHRYMTTKVRLLKRDGLLGIALALFASVASAEDNHCRHEAGKVVCSEEGFNILVDRCVGFRRDGDLCALRRDAIEKELAETRKALALTTDALKACQSIDPKEWKAPAALALGAVGAGLVVASVAAPLDGGGRASLGLSGALLLGGGLFVISF